MSSQETDALRAMVREVLREVLPRAAAEPEDAEQSGGLSPRNRMSSASSATQQSTPSGLRRVHVRDDRDLDALVTQVLDLAEDPDRLEELRAGRLRFALERPEPVEHVAPGAPEPLEVERGAVTERLVHRAAREQRPLRIGPRAVVTPLARDRARALGVSIVRTTVPSEQGRESR